MGSFGRRVERQLVDGFGLVGCPRQERDVPLVEACLGCRELVGAVRDAAGEVVEIRCRAVPPPLDAAATFGP